MIKKSSSANFFKEFPNDVKKNTKYALIMLWNVFYLIILTLDYFSGLNKLFSTLQDSKISIYYVHWL